MYLSREFIDKIAQKSLDLYNKLPKTGKPIETEWTVLSCFIKYDKTDDVLEVVSLGTGSKCIGATKMSHNGEILNDSHAEVLARRGMLLYLYDNIAKNLKGETSIFITENEKMNLRENIEFIFYSSQLPCGDASIIPKTGEEEHYGHILKPQKRVAEDEIITDNKKPKYVDDVYRTGAKCLPHCEQDSKQSGLNYHILSQVRTKPGRGDRTLSVSCSDKMAKWLHIGVQGGLLALLCEPIYIKYFIFGAGVPYSNESLLRALVNRNCVSNNLLNIIPEFYQTSLVFPKIKNDINIRPAPGSLIWVKDVTQISEVAVQGKKLGVTKKNEGTPRNSLCISKYNIYRRFLNILSINLPLRNKICNYENIESIPYNEMKRKSKRYIEKWLEVKSKFFKTWTVKPDMWDFCVSHP